MVQRLCGARAAENKEEKRSGLRDLRLQQKVTSGVEGKGATCWSSDKSGEMCGSPAHGFVPLSSGRMNWLSGRERETVSWLKRWSSKCKGVTGWGQHDCKWVGTAGSNVLWIKSALVGKRWLLCEWYIQGSSGMKELPRVSVVNFRFNLKKGITWKRLLSGFSILQNVMKNSFKSVYWMVSLEFIKGPHLHFLPV